MDERPGPDDYAPFYQGYVTMVPAGDLRTILRTQIEDTVALVSTPAARERAGHRYAPGKWTVREVVGHLADTERVLSYRALRIARADATPLAGFDENDYVAAANFEQRSLDELVDGLRVVRAATADLFDTLTDEAWRRRGVANGREVTVLAVAAIIAGHELHHRRILAERYLVAADASAASEDANRPGSDTAIQSPDALAPRPGVPLPNPRA
jgi:hypothetical protein